jgi:hypothetical protein
MTKFTIKDVPDLGESQLPYPNTRFHLQQASCVTDQEG